MTLSRRPVFQDPVRAFQELPIITDYKIGEQYIIAQEGENQLTAELKEGPMYVWGSSLKLDYSLNGRSIGWRTFQLNPQTQIFRAGKIEVDPAFQNQGLGKMILLHDLHQVHRLGWIFSQMITNPILVHTAVKTRFEGHRIFEPGTMIQYQVQNYDPWGPEMVNIGDPVSLEHFNPEGLVISDRGAYQITGRPNPKFFEALEAARLGSPRR